MKIIYESYAQELDNECPFVKGSYIGQLRCVNHCRYLKSHDIENKIIDCRYHETRQTEEVKYYERSKMEWNVKCIENMNLRHLIEKSGLLEEK